ncbi:MAG: DoxX family membrane protein [Acidobacteriaceae bacterium]|nr:DoxX family membrane protein [Acidobacteriaceae bacterium]
MGSLLRDFVGLAMLVLGSLAAGLVLNKLSHQPLPIAYQMPEQRFDAELTTLVTSAPLQIAAAPTVKLPEFRSAVEAKKALILDARPFVFYEQGHVPGALNLARDDFARDYRHLSAILQSSAGKAIIVYCSGGNCHDSRLVANALLTLGFSNVSVFTGGWEAWSAAGLPTSTEKGGAMMPPGKKGWDRVLFVISLALAAVFIYAGADKVRDPLEVADSIAAFAILPRALINLFALSLPPFEIACGFLLFWRSTRRFAALAVLVISLVFFAALSSALLRGLTLDCGCFGAGTPSRPRMWLELGLNVVLAGASLLIYLRSVMASLATTGATWEQPKAREFD